MNNKGFTLIELIATILLLSIISVISYISITNVIQVSKKNDCNALINNIKTATNEYVSDNRYKSSFTSNVNEGLSVTITAKVLIDNNYLSAPIVNPLDKHEMNVNDISIVIYLNRDYTANIVEVSGIDCGE